MQLLLQFSIPLLAGNALQQFYYIINNIIIGRFVGEAALAGIAVAFSITFLLSTLFTGFSGGAMILISKYYGGNAYENLHKQLRLSIPYFLL